MTTSRIGKNRHKQKSSKINVIITGIQISTMNGRIAYTTLKVRIIVVTQEKTTNIKEKKKTILYKETNRT